VHLPNLILWLSVVGAAWMASSILRQYVGDVAIYVSSHEVNRFGQTRQEILRRCADLATRVFQRGREGDWEYDRIVFVGHSLGSVIAYDVLNDLLLNDYTGQTALDVRARTLALLTFGSPLDKIAFLYRTQKGLGSDVREAGASSAQPLISHYGFRPPHWINLYNESDWISGSLDYFDDPAQPAAAGRAIANIRDGEAFIPFLAHTQYWETHPLPMLLHWLIRETGRGPVTAPLRVGSAAPAATAATAATATAEADHR
jgi:hypothetical protein